MPDLTTPQLFSVSIYLAVVVAAQQIAMAGGNADVGRTRQLCLAQSAAARFQLDETHLATRTENARSGNTVMTPILQANWWRSQDRVSHHWRYA